ncbi:GSU2403 family nucleotidyltransferase fold protein [Novosphingobium sp. RL4]|uniref:GSU2403 family nucleotidyltransferase fold protein n=1 Tax=Novosphingobium sp. RL4 TaxID=3109595 RepID=UPI002D797A2E|nr:GSU2403 family nucleotidyltransferase fold protein [Novosphingobium sp. RL4]WRT94841.1 GSU2403 family nucleotidyltransferase fold protein [Novosphingobium sp. RL4]
MPRIRPFSDEQSRLLVNLRQRYEVWIDAERDLAALPYDLRRKTVSGREYLYRIFDRGGNGKSLGPLTPEREAELHDYHSRKDALKERIRGLRPALAESAALYRALRLPLLSSDAGPILRECDRRALLGSHLLVVGTNAIAAYMVEANGRIDLPDETEDFDLAWVSRSAQENERRVWDMLKAVDSTFTINAERDFQARNARAYEVELLVAPSRAATLGGRDQPRPVPLPEQEWLLLGRPVDQVVGCRDGSPARIVAPDPRWFALHKLWMAAQAKRNPLKRPKDRVQGLALLDAVAEAMPHYPMDAAFRAEIPEEILPHFTQWQEESGPAEDSQW